MTGITRPPCLAGGRLVMRAIRSNKRAAQARATGSALGEPATGFGTVDGIGGVKDDGGKAKKSTDTMDVKIRVNPVGMFFIWGMKNAGNLRPQEEDDSADSFTNPRRRGG